MSSKIPEIISEILNHLYNGYLESPTGLFDIASIVKKYGEDPIEFGKLLAEREWIKNQMYQPTTLLCQITRSGIKQVAQDYFKDYVNTIISNLGIMGGRARVMEILSLEPKDFHKAFDIVKELEDSGYIKKGIYTDNDVIIELSLRGREYYNNNSAKFF